MQIEINITNKKAVAKETYTIVCGNNDYKILFTFDDEWTDHKTKTARFNFSQGGMKKHIDVVFDGSECNMPAISNTALVEIGVFAGDLQTTTPCLLQCEKSILCDCGLPEEPPENVYNQIIKKCNKAIDTANEAKEIVENADINVELKADWNQNDETQSDHIKNRPFYTTFKETTSSRMVNWTLGNEETHSAAQWGLIIGNTYSITVRCKQGATIVQTYQLDLEAKNVSYLSNDIVVLITEDTFEEGYLRIEDDSLSNETRIPYPSFDCEYNSVQIIVAGTFNNPNVVAIPPKYIKKLSAPNFKEEFLNSLATKNDVSNAVNDIVDDIEELDRTIAEIIENSGGSGEGEEDTSDIDKLFESQVGKNILIQDSENGYYNGTEKKASTNHIRTPSPISLESGHSLLTLTTDLTVGNSSNLFCIIWLDETGNSIKATSKSTQTVVKENDGRTAFEIPTNATAFLVWLSGVKTSGDTLANFSLQYDNHSNATFVPYVPPVKVIKKQHLPYGVQPLYGKTIVNFGDSIFGNYKFPNDISTEIAKLTGATIHNCGFGGCQMSEHSSEDYKPFSMCKLADAIASGDFTTQDEKANGTVVPSYFKSHVDLLKSIDFTYVDIITIAYGTNDFTASDALENPDNNKDTTKFAGALRYSIETLLSAYPHLKIFVCSQTYRFWNDGSGNFSEDSDTKTFNGLKLTDFVAKTKEVAEEYHIPYIDNYNIGMNKHNRSVYFSATDGTHPILKGRHLIAAHIAKELF